MAVNSAKMQFLSFGIESKAAFHSKSKGNISEKQYRGLKDRSPTKWTDFQNAGMIL